MVEAVMMPMVEKLKLAGLLFSSDPSTVTHYSLDNARVKSAQRQLGWACTPISQLASLRKAKEDFSTMGYYSRCESGWRKSRAVIKSLR
jgi:hypothetical protein